MPDWTHIVVHHSASPDNDWIDAQDFERWHRSKGWRDIGYHYVVEGILFSADRPGSESQVVHHAIMGRDLSKIGAHCFGMNSRAIGVCFAGDWSLFAPPPEQLDEGAQLIAGLCSALRIQPSNVVPHRQFRQTQCPGNAFPMEQLRLLVRDHMGD